MRISKSLLTLILALILGLAGSTAAQDDHSPETSKVERKNRAPVSKDVLKVTLPRASEATLSNGLTVLVMENHEVLGIITKSDLLSRR